MIFSSEERAKAWSDVITAAPSDRAFKRHLLAAVAFQPIGSQLGLYTDNHAAALRDSFDLLDRGGNLRGRRTLRDALEAIDDSTGTAWAFVAALGRELDEAASTDGLTGDEQARAEALAEWWRSADFGTEEYLTVADLATLYEVTPQAVYQWIHKGVIDAHQRPGGSYQISVGSLAAARSFDLERARRLRQLLARRHGDKAPVSAEEMLAQMRERRAAPR